MSCQVCFILLAAIIFGDESPLSAGTGTGTASLAPYLDLRDMKADSVYLTWNIQALEELNVNQIKVIFTSEEHDGIYGYATAPVSKGQLTVDELEPNTLYDVNVEATGKGVTIVYPIGHIRTRSTDMPVPIFEANYTEDIEILDMLLQEPKGYEGYFDGFEILWKVGGLEAQYPWQSVVNLTDGQRVYEMDGVETSMKYAVTARGLVLPDSISEMADPLVFETMDAELSVPQNINLQVVDPYTVRMTWEPPVKPYRRITGYTIEWKRDFELQESLNLSPVNFFDFTDLKPGVTIATSICAHNHPGTSVKFDYVGTRSAFMEVTIPPHIQGMRKPKFEAVYHEDINDLHIKIHKPEDVIGHFGGFEILHKIGPPNSTGDWQSVVKLSPNTREYEMEKLSPLLMHSVTVRGLILPNTFSEMADPLVFQITHSDCSVPQNVKLRAANPRTMLMAWHRPACSNGHITGYTIDWVLNSVRQKSIQVKSSRFHVFNKLDPRTTIAASVYAHSQPEASVKFEYIGTPSALTTAATPAETRKTGVFNSTSLNAINEGHRGTKVINRTRRVTPSPATKATVTTESRVSSSASAVAMARASTQAISAAMTKANASAPAINKAGKSA